MPVFPRLRPREEDPADQDVVTDHGPYPGPLGLLFVPADGRRQDQTGPREGQSVVHLSRLSAPRQCLINPGNYLFELYV